MLFVSSVLTDETNNIWTSFVDWLFTEVDNAEFIDRFDHDYLSTLSLTTYIEEVVKKILSKMCEICSIFLIVTSTDSTLKQLKNRRKLIFSSDDVIKINMRNDCTRILRENLNIKNVKNILCRKAFQRIYEGVFNNDEMTPYFRSRIYEW